MYSDYIKKTRPSLEVQFRIIGQYIKYQNSTLFQTHFLKLDIFHNIKVTLLVSIFSYYNKILKNVMVYRLWLLKNISDISTVQYNT